MNKSEDKMFSVLFYLNKWLTISCFRYIIHLSAFKVGVGVG